MASQGVAFVAGFLLAGLVSLAYIRLLRRKIKSYELYVRHRIDEQIAKLLPSQALAAPTFKTVDSEGRMLAIFSGVRASARPSAALSSSK